MIYKKNGAQAIGNLGWRGYAFAAGISCLTWSNAAMADSNWPSKPIRLVVAGPAGGSADSLARLLAEGMHQKLNKPVIVENKPGAAGVLAVNDLQANGKDGYTFLMIQGGVVSETPLAYKVHYKPFTDLKPLAQLSRIGLVLVANKELPISNLQELVSYAKNLPEGLNFASYATGMRAHTAGMLLGQLTNIKLKHVGYKGSPPGLTDLMGGHVPLMFDGVATSLPLLKAGKIKPIAVYYPTRIAELPNVPTFKELGYPQLAQAGWFGLWSRPDTPLDIQQKVRDVALDFLKQPAAQNRLKDLGMEPGTNANSDELMADLKLASQQQATLLKSINYQAE